jgi:transcriptional regulator with XRE-family HTH domain
MAKRSDTPNGPAIVDMRRKKGWTVDDLANAAGLTRRTIQRIQGCNPVDIGTLQRVAHALNVEYQTLILQEPIETEPQAGPKKNIQLIFKTPIEDFDAAQDLPAIIDAIRSLTTKYFDMKTGALGRQLVVTLEMNSEAINDMTAGGASWARELLDVGVHHILFYDENGNEDGEQGIG